VSIPRASLCFEVQDDVILLVHGRDAPDDAEWRGFVDEAGGAMTRSPRPVLVVSDGGHPSVSQRRVMRGMPVGGVRTAVVTDSLVARGAVTIEAWFDGTIRAFPKNNAALVEALRYLGVDPSRDDAIGDAIGGMLNAVTGGVPPGQ
jgi:hypothetical protein